MQIVSVTIMQQRLGKTVAGERLKTPVGQAVKDFHAGQDTPLFQTFKDEVVLALVLGHELHYLEPVAIAACRGGDLCGDFNFRRKITRKYFEMFLDVEDRNHYGEQIGKCAASPTMI
jgi:hypothetical protein